MTMNTDDHNREVIQRVMCETLEDFAFIFADPVEPGTVDDVAVAGESLAATVDFSGESQTGAFRIVMPIALCKEMAASVLGLDETEVTDAAVEDAVRELGNIVTGALVVAMFGVEAVFTLSAPVAERLSMADMKALANDAETVLLNADGQLLAGALTRN